MTGLVAAALASPGPVALSVAGAAEAAADDTPHKLTSTLKVGVKTVLNERVPDGARIGTVVRVYNTGSRAAAVPGYEVRAVTTGGEVYTLSPSAGNPRVVQPKEKAELSYMLTVGRSDSFTLKRLEWVEVDEFVYPKKETVVLNIPVTGLEWQGQSTVFSDAKRLKGWGESFTIPTESAELVYTPVRLSERHTPQGTTAVLVLQAKNTGKRPAWVPEFSVTGKTAQNYYPAQRAESGSIEVQPGASRYLHFVMRLSGKESWKSFTISTPESFRDSSGNVRYEAGRIQIKPPAAPDKLEVQSPYALFDPIRVSSTFRPNLAKEVEIALAEVTRFEQMGDGYLTAVVKFRLLNRSGVTLSIPDFGVEWTTSGGISYAGERLETRQKTLMPGVGLMVAYVFTLPMSTATDEKARLTLLDGNPDVFQLPVGAVEISLGTPGASSDSLYPFKVNISSGSLDSSGRLVLDVGVTRTPNVVYDEKSVRLKLEVADEDNRVLVSRTYALAGADRLYTGRKTFDLAIGSGKDEVGKDAGVKNTDSEAPDADESGSGEPEPEPAPEPVTVVVRVYEVLATSGGDVERLIKTMRVTSS